MLALDAGWVLLILLIVAAWLPFCARPAPRAQVAFPEPTERPPLPGAAGAPPTECTLSQNAARWVAVKYIMECYPEGRTLAEARWREQSWLPTHRGASGVCEYRAQDWVLRVAPGAGLFVGWVVEAIHHNNGFQWRGVVGGSRQVTEIAVRHNRN